VPASAAELSSSGGELSSSGGGPSMGLCSKIGSKMRLRPLMLEKDDAKAKRECEGSWRLRVLGFASACCFSDGFAYQ